MWNAGLGEARADAVGERLLELGQSERRQLLGAEFHQEVGGAHAPPFDWLAASMGKPNASRLS